MTLLNKMQRKVTKDFKDPITFKDSSNNVSDIDKLTNRITEVPEKCNSI